MASISLFPPVIDSYLNAFKSQESLKVFFKLPKTNTMNDIADVHITITRQDTNQNVLDPYIYPNGIKMNNIIYTYSDGINSKNYVYINPGDISGGWEKGCIYKIQIRFSSVVKSPTSDESSWLVTNSSNFSEWSTITTTKVIGDVYVLVQNFEEGLNSTSNEEIVLYLTSLEFNGIYNNEDDYSEKLKSYQVFLYDKNHKIIEDSGEIIYTNEGLMNYEFKTITSSNTDYILGYKAITKNYYIIEKEFPFNLQQISTDTLNVEIFASEDDRIDDEDEGCLTVHIEAVDKSVFSGNINVQRSSSLSNFQKWETVYNTKVNGSVINFSFKDYTIESGIYYKYCARKVIVSEINGSIIENNGSFEYMQIPCIRVFDKTYLLGKKGKQLKLSLNYSMSSFQYKQNDAVTESLGGKYPFITRNGNLGYKTFPMQGTISLLMDDNNKFVTETELYGTEEIQQYYQEYNDYFEINSQYDYTKEKFFRDKIINFLQDGEAKLYKSSTEGNLIIRLTDVSFTPNNTLGRLIYDFSATAYEIAEPSIENYLKYNFFTIDDYSLDFTTREIHVGQYMDSKCPIETDVYKKFIEPKYAYCGKNILKYTYTVTNVYKVKIQFNSKPMLITDINGNDFLGYKMCINGVDVTVGKNGYYELDKNTSLFSLSFYGDKDKKINKVDVTIDFLYELTRDLTKGKTIKSRSIDRNIGQYFESVKPGEFIYNTIYFRNYFEWEKRYQKITQINAITIEAEPNTVLNIKDYRDNVLEKHIIGSTGILNFSDFDEYSSVINNISLYGTYYGELKEYELKQYDLKEKGDKHSIYLSNEENQYYMWNKNHYVNVEVGNDGKIYDTVSKVDLNILYRYIIEKGTYY